VEALAELPAAQAVPLLERIASSHPRLSVQEEAMETLAEVDPEQADRVLEALLRDPDVPAELRMEALSSLAERRRSPRALELVQQAAMTDPSTEVQREAVAALTEFPAEDAAPRLERIIWEHPHSEARVEAVENTSELPAELAAPILDRVLREHGDVEVVREAVDALEELPEELALPLLIRVAREHALAEVREDARDQLGEAVKRR
jgi:HEAT repeat protein